MMRYQKNLRVEGNKVYSYNTHVATIDGGKLYAHGWWSVTTSKHINHVAAELGLERVKETVPRDQIPTDNGLDNLKTVANVASLGNIFSDNQAEANAWKARMLKAGLGDGLSLPEDWSDLDEATKEARLDAAIAQLKL